jgi:TonB family protein
MHNLPLEKIKIAASCNAEWRWMYGDDQVRFCGQCNQNVYNLSALSREQAEDLIRQNEGQLCVRFYRRADGTILTKNCSVGLQAVKDKLTTTRTHIIAAILTFFAYLGVLWWLDRPAMGRTEMGGELMQEPLIVAPLVEKNEQFIREKAVFKVMPVFQSASAKRAKDEVVVRIMISPPGEVVNATFIEGDATLREVAEEAARRWRFEPMLVDGRPARIESRLTFQLRQ